MICLEKSKSVVLMLDPNVTRNTRRIWINVLVTSFCCICLPTLWVYYKYFNSSGAEIVFIRQNLYRRQILTYKDGPRAEMDNNTQTK